MKGTGGFSLKKREELQAGKSGSSKRTPLLRHSCFSSSKAFPELWVPRAAPGRAGGLGFESWYRYGMAPSHLPERDPREPRLSGQFGAEARGNWRQKEREQKYLSRLVKEKREAGEGKEGQRCGESRWCPPPSRLLERQRQADLPAAPNRGGRDEHPESKQGRKAASLGHAGSGSGRVVCPVLPPGAEPLRLPGGQGRARGLAPLPDRDGTGRDGRLSPGRGWL